MSTVIQRCKCACHSCFRKVYQLAALVFVMACSSHELIAKPDINQTPPFIFPQSRNGVAEVQENFGKEISVAFALAGIVAFIFLTCRCLQVLRNRRRASSYLLTRLIKSERATKAAHETLLQDAQSLTLHLQVMANCLQDKADLNNQMEAVLREADQLLVNGQADVLGLQLSPNFRGELEQRFAELGYALTEGTSTKFSLLVNGDAGDAVELEAKTSEKIFLIGREALFNAYSHAQANKVEMEMTYTFKHFILHVRDDGVGIDANQVAQAINTDQSGLHMMHAQAALIDGKLSIWSATSLGCELLLVVPLTTISKTA